MKKKEEKGKEKSKPKRGKSKKVKQKGGKGAGELLTSIKEVILSIGGVGREIGNEMVAIT